MISGFIFSGLKNWIHSRAEAEAASLLDVAPLRFVRSFGESSENYLFSTF